MEFLRKSIKLEEWPQVLEQTTMFLVILGRWMLPKGNLTREQLSQLLLVYLGMAADILEFSSESLAQPVVACDLVKIGIVTGIWGMSLCQFTLVLTSVAGPKIRNFKNKKRKRGQDVAEGKTEDPLVDFVEQDINEKRPSICGSEIWSLLLVLFMQDCPFLAMRLYLIIQIKVVDRAMLFFAGKNLLVFMLVTYRIIVLCGEHNGKTKVRPVPLVGFPQQPQVDAMIVRKQRSSWSLDPLLSRVTDFTNRLRNHVQVLDQEIGRRRGVHVPSGSDQPTTKPMTPFLVAMDGHSVEVTEIDNIDSITLDTTGTEIIDTARSLPSTVDDGTTKAGETDPDGVDDTSSPILNLHHDDQPVPSMVEVGNDFEEIISLSDDSVNENLQAVGNELTLGLGNDDQMKPADLNDESTELPLDSSLNGEFKNT
ncbi:uncharacterized protein LOC105437928 [Strongylocentrotus purpuratus]|uniref:Transmembrane protein 26 n=1 Tax=Strongylocentrotus purpuratus TaxID=7668 RepID=A0A7M7P788_STRPU|nr:uncharacterized protein LOC105437928 [Strongylocentrotus purpuratus]